MRKRILAKFYSRYKCKVETDNLLLTFEGTSRARGGGFATGKAATRCVVTGIYQLVKKSSVSEVINVQIEPKTARARVREKMRMSNIYGTSGCRNGYQDRREVQQESQETST